MRSHNLHRPKPKLLTLSLVEYMYPSRLFFSSAVLLRSASFLSNTSNLRLASTTFSFGRGIPGPVVFSITYILTYKLDSQKNCINNNGLENSFFKYLQGNSESPPFQFLFSTKIHIARIICSGI